MAKPEQMVAPGEVESPRLRSATSPEASRSDGCCCSVLRLAVSRGRSLVASTQEQAGPLLRGARSRVTTRDPSYGSNPPAFGRLWWLRAKQFAVHVQAGLCQQLVLKSTSARHLQLGTRTIRSAAVLHHFGKWFSVHPLVAHEERITIQELAHMKSGGRKRNTSFEQQQLLEGDQLLPSGVAHARRLAFCLRKL